jgi:hypothetical protein
VTHTPLTRTENYDDKRRFNYDYATSHTFLEIEL